MKRNSLVLVLACVLLLTAAACGEHGDDLESSGAPVPTESEAVPVSGSATAVMKIMEINEYGGIVAVYWNTDYPGPYFVSLSNDVSIIGETGEALSESDLRAGMVMEIQWPGMVLYSSPAKIPDVTLVRMIGKEDDFVGLYRAVIQELWETDSGLNGDITQISLDFSALTNLTDGEREALEYLVSCDLGLGLGVNVVNGAYIDREDLYWEDGVLLSIELTEQGADRLVFTAMKWRGAERAVWLTDCVAVRGENGAWTWETGGCSIS